MRVLLDTNTMIDYLATREPFYQNANKIIGLITRNRVTGYVNTSSITDIYYILRKTLSDAESRGKVRAILQLLHAIEVTKADCFTALDSPMTDFEDALVTVCAEKVNLDYIVTRDGEFLKLPIAIKIISRC
jgi:predicted nucleic acid-binding protein